MVCGIEDRVHALGDKTLVPAQDAAVRQVLLFSGAIFPAPGIRFQAGMPEMRRRLAAQGREPRQNRRERHEPQILNPGEKALVVGQHAGH